MNTNDRKETYIFSEKPIAYSNYSVKDIRHSSSIEEQEERLFKKQAVVLRYIELSEKKTCKNGTIEKDDIKTKFSLFFEDRIPIEIIFPNDLLKKYSEIKDKNIEQKADNPFFKDKQLYDSLIYHTNLKKSKMPKINIRNKKLLAVLLVAGGITLCGISGPTIIEKLVQLDNKQFEEQLEESGVNDLYEEQQRYIDSSEAIEQYYNDKAIEQETNGKSY